MILTDQLNRNITVNKSVKSVISLVPSHTELLFELGLKNIITGRTKFCIHPISEIQHVPIVGGTKNIHHDIIKSLNPDLIIANKEENRQEDVLILEKEFPVWVSDIKTLEDSMHMIHQIATPFSAVKLAKSIQSETLEKIKSLATEVTKRAVYLIWQEPFMTIGSDTYIHNMMTHLGYENVFGDRYRYPEVSIEDIKQANPDLILLSSEPFPFKEKHRIQFEKLFENIQIDIVDGEVFSWYGSRMIHKTRILIP